jgi:hypothetical protein
VADETSERYGKPEFYEVTPTSGVPFKVHWTRCSLLDGVDVPDRERAKEQGWGDSVLQACYIRLAALAGVYCNVESITEDFIQTILKMENLQELIAADQEDLVQKRINIIDQTRHVLNTILLDSREDYDKKASSVTGLDGIIQEFAVALSAVTNIPVTKLMGRSPAGENATGESDMRQWYDEVAALQKDKLRPPLDWVIGVLQDCSEYKLPGDELAVTFLPLWQPTDKEKADAYKTNAEADASYIDRGVLLPEEVVVARFQGEGAEDTGIEVDLEERKRLLEAAAKEKEKLQKEVDAEIAKREAEEAGRGMGPPEPEED